MINKLCLVVKSFSNVCLCPVVGFATGRSEPATSNDAGSGGSSIAAELAKADPIADRRRAKALKLLDAKMAELSQEPEGWDDVVRCAILSSIPFQCLKISAMPY
jgi:hypothetical protein